tara:strand:- start:769 stop:1878 length:1110 start_codon:yes stop_codon:yes gene_type:complete
MISPEDFFKELTRFNVSFFTGIPDSLLSSFCAYIDDHLPEKNHIIGSNEGGCVSLAAGHYLSTGKIPLVYLQNSGLGNIVNPLTSLIDKEVYSIPMLLLIGYRGRPGIPDEPQHEKMGRITLSLLDCLEIPYAILKKRDDPVPILKKAFHLMKQKKVPFALVVEKGTFSFYESNKKYKNAFNLVRKDALKYCLENMANDSVIVSTTGHLSRELYQYRPKGEKDFKVIGAMGHANQIAMGIAQNIKRLVFCFDGDGASLMHLGNWAICGQKAEGHFKHVLFNNGVHGSVGGQKTVGHEVDFLTLAKGCGYKSYFKVSSMEDLKRVWGGFQENPGPSFLEILTNTEVEKNLPRPKETPQKSKGMFMDFLSE